MFWLGLFIGAVIGGILGYFVAIICVIASERRSNDGNDKKTRQ